MKLRRLSVLLSLVCVAGLGDGAGAAARQDQNTLRAFQDEFSQALQIHDAAKMQALVKRRANVAAWAIVEASQRAKTGGREDDVAMRDALADAWTQAMQTEYPAKIRAFFDGLDDEGMRKRVKLKSEQNLALRHYHEFNAAKDYAGLDGVGTELERLAGAFTELGDLYYAAQAWLSYGTCFDDGIRGKENADYEKAKAGLEKCVAIRREIGLVDTDTHQAEGRIKYLELALAGGRSKKAKEASARPPAAGPLVSVGLEFELLTDLDAYERPSFTLDVVHPLWEKLYLEQGTRDSTTFRTLGEDSPNVLRLAGTDVRIDCDGDGTGDLRIPLLGRQEPIQFPIGSGERRRQWGVITTVGTELDSFNEIRMDLSPTETRIRVFFTSAASMVGMLDGTAIRVCDDNLDGVYGSLPREVAYDGLGEGYQQPELDSVVIGSSKRAVPWSEYLQVGGKWYFLESKNGGTALYATPVELKTGKLRLKFSKGKPTWMVLRGRNELADTFVDVSDGTVEVPVGEYALYWGELRKGKDLRVMKCVVLPGPETPTWKVESGETTDVDLGAPFRFEFTFENEAESFKVAGQSVTVVGSAGERYVRTWNCVARPSVTYRKVGAKKGSKPVEMVPCLDRDQLAANSPQNKPNLAAWYPLDLTVEKRKNEEEVEVQLIEKKNELFGDIQSEWVTSSLQK